MPISNSSIVEASGFLAMDVSPFVSPFAGVARRTLNHPPRRRLPRRMRWCSSASAPFPSSTRVVPRELEIETLMRHASLHGADPAPGVEPGAEGGEHGQIRVCTSGLERDEQQAAEAVSHDIRVRSLAFIEHRLSCGHSA